MATFKFGRRINIHWNGYDIVGPADTVFSIPDQLYEEFNADIAGVEPTLQWIDTNEFQTLKNSVPTGGYVAKVIGTSPVSISSTSNTSTISISSGTAGNGYLLVADGTGGTIWNPASTSGLTSVVGISPISSVVSGGTVSVSINTTGFQSAGSYQPAGSYQTAGNYASSASGTSPISATLSTAGVLSVSIDATATSAENAARTRTKVRNSTASTITKGSVVYIVGSSGTVPTIEKALANADATSSRTFGIVETDITSNTDGYVTNQGLLTGLDTSADGIVDGAVLWLSPTIAGAYTTTKPAGPNHGVLVGIVVKGQTAGAGSIYVLIKNGAELDEIHDVNISALANGQALIYSSTASVWQNQVLPVASVSGTSPIAATTTTSTGAVSLSITAGSINSTHLSATSVGSTQLIDGSVTSAKIGAAAVNTSKISSGLAALNAVLKADGVGGASFGAISTYAITVSEFIASGTWTNPTSSTISYVLVIGGGGGGCGRGSGANRGGSGANVVGRFFKAADLGATETVTIGSGGSGGAAGASGVAGSSTTFGSKITATGGEKGVQGGATDYFTVGRVLISDGTSSYTVDGRGATTAVSVAAANSFYGTAGGGTGATTATGNGLAGGGGFGTPSGGTGATYVAQATGVAGGNGTTIGSGGGGGAGGTTTGGKGGNGYLGGGGGTGGAGVTTGGAGGNGGDGYVLVISW